MTLRIPAKVLLHVCSYDFYDMTLSTGKQRRHMINEGSLHDLVFLSCFNASIGSNRYICYMFKDGSPVVHPCFFLSASLLYLSSLILNVASRMATIPKTCQCNVHRIFFFSEEKNKNKKKKIKTIHWKDFDLFNIFAQNIHCGYTLEPPPRLPQCMFWIKNKKKYVYPCKPQFFFYIKVGYSGVSI